MRKLWTVAALGIASLVLLTVHTPRAAHPALAIAQESMNFTVQGKITRHMGNKLTVNTEGNIIFRVVYNEKTKIARPDNSEGTAKDLQVGIRIHVDGDLQESGEIIALKITIQQEGTR